MQDKNLVSEDHLSLTNIKCTLKKKKKKNCTTIFMLAGCMIIANDRK